MRDWTFPKYQIILSCFKILVHNQVFMASNQHFVATSSNRSKSSHFSDHAVFSIAVYPQKQQPYAYGYAYPGPYYHGAAYGPYAQYWVEKRWWAVAADTQKKISTAASPFVWMDDGCFLSVSYLYEKVPAWEWQKIERERFFHPFFGRATQPPRTEFHEMEFCPRGLLITRLNFCQAELFFKLINDESAFGF